MRRRDRGGVSRAREARAEPRRAAGGGGGRRTAQTVLGPVSVDQLGITMMHEHLLIDTTAMLVEPREASRRAAFHAP